MPVRNYSTEDKQFVINNPKLTTKELFAQTNLSMDQVYMFRKIKKETTKHKDYDLLNRLALGFRL